MKFSNQINSLSLKTILAINLFLAILVFIPLTIYLSQKQTRLAGKAALPIPPVTLIPPSPTPTPPLIIPQGKPEIFGFRLFYGKAGDAVIIAGKNFGSQKQKVFFNNLEASHIISWSNNEVVALVPDKATAGPIKIGGVASPYNFIVFSARSEQLTACELTFKAFPSEKTLGLKTCPLISKVKFVLKPEPDLSPASLPSLISPIFPLSSTSLTAVTKEGLFEAELSLPPNFPAGDFLTIKIPKDRKLTLVSAELYDQERLIPFFVNPLNLIQ